MKRKNDSKLTVTDVKKLGKVHTASNLDLLLTLFDKPDLDIDVKLCVC